MRRAQPSPTKPARDRDGTLPIAALLPGPMLLAQAGLDPAAIASEAGLSPERFDDPGAVLSFTEIGRYLFACLRASRDETLALRIGLALGPAAMDATGYLARHSSDVRTALTMVREHLHLAGGAMELDVRAGIATLEYRFLYPHLPAASLILEGAMGNTVATLRGLCGPAWSATEIHLSRSLPTDPARWRRCLHAPVVFGAEADRVLFAARWLDQRVEGADPDLRRLLHERLADIELAHDAEFPERVASVIRAALLADDASPAHVAQRLALSPRTLRRRLGEHGTTFSALLGTTRREIACQLLENSAATVAQIAELLGYAHTSAFTRAFIGWKNMSPGAWRSRVRGRSA